MKKMFEIFRKAVVAIALFFLATNALFSMAEATIKIVDVEKKVFALFVNNVTTENLTVKIFNTDGNVLFEEKGKVNLNFSRKYDLSNLPEGKYFVQVEDALSFSKQLIQITYRGLVIPSEEIIKVFHPKVKVEPNYVDINMLVLGISNVNIRILETDGTEIFAELIHKENAIHRRYLTEQLPSGKYIIKIEAGGKVFDKVFDVKKIES